MAIDTRFSFRHFRNGQAALAAAVVDKLGPLRGFVGNKTESHWAGSGFNMIWRPNHGNSSGPRDFFLELNFTSETLDFEDITGGGIANRGFLQNDIALGGLFYLQKIKDSFDESDQHFEPGVWANVPDTSNPKEIGTVARMGSIPHGTTINLQGPVFEVKDPQFDPASITPFRIGEPDDGKSGLVPFPEEKLANASESRTPLDRVKALTQDQLTNPNLFLKQAIAGQDIVKTTVLKISSDTTVTKVNPNPVPNAGGGTDNIAFLTGVGEPKTGGPNALAPRVTALFWIERVRDAKGVEYRQIQYTQRVLLNFNGLSWPHITVATLREVPGKP
jgi:hypothetical protein